MTALIDTHVLAWLVGDPARVSRAATEYIADADVLSLSAVVAFEFDDLARRGRLPGVASLAIVLREIDMVVLPVPADLWKVAARLPLIHRDPVDRMLIAHAIQADLTLVTADDKIRGYPVRTLW